MIPPRAMAASHAAVGQVAALVARWWVRFSDRQLRRALHWRAKS